MFASGAELPISVLAHQPRGVARRPSSENLSWMQVYLSSAGAEAERALYSFNTEYSANICL